MCSQVLFSFECMSNSWSFQRLQCYSLNVIHAFPEFYQFFCNTKHTHEVVQQSSAVQLFTDLDINPCD